MYVHEKSKYILFEVFIYQGLSSIFHWFNVNMVKTSVFLLNQAWSFTSFWPISLSNLLPGFWMTYFFKYTKLSMEFVIIVQWYNMSIYYCHRSFFLIETHKHLSKVKVSLHSHLCIYGLYSTHAFCRQKQAHSWKFKIVISGPNFAERQV